MFKLIVVLLSVLSIGEFFNYETHEKTPNELSFGYSKSQFCTIQKYNSDYYGTICDAYSFQKSTPSKLKTIGNGEIYTVIAKSIDSN